MIRLSTSLAALTLQAALALAPLALGRDALAQATPGAGAPDRQALGADASGLAPAGRWSREVAVSGRDAAEEREAQMLAMRAVLLANSDDKTLLNRDEVRAALRDAQSYVERFEYRTPAPGTVIPADTPLTDAVRARGEATRLLQVTFDDARLEALIGGGGTTPVDAAASAAAGAAAGAAPSPEPFVDVDAALVLLLIEDGRREILVSDPAADNVRARAREIAGASGVSLVYPSGDAEDRAALDAADIREERLERIRLAAERYAPNTVLVGRLSRDGLAAWEGRWTKLAGTAVARERFVTDSLDAALQAGLGWLAAGPGGASGDERYRYGGAAPSEAEALVWVGPLDSVAAYATTMDFLAGVPGVGTVYPKEIDERGMAFTVVPRGALPAIAAAAEATGWLRRTAPPIGASPLDGRGGAGAFAGTDTRWRRLDAVRRPLASNAELAFDYLR